MATTRHRLTSNVLIIFAILAISLTALCPAHSANAAEKKQTHTLINLADHELEGLFTP